MAITTFATLDLVHFRLTVDRLHQEVARDRGRIEITRDGSSEVCVLISKAELEGLERALEILASTDDYQTMCREISGCAAATCPPLMGVQT